MTQVLGLVSDLRNHPAATLVKSNFPLVISRYGLTNSVHVFGRQIRERLLIGCIIAATLVKSNFPLVISRYY